MPITNRIHWDERLEGFKGQETTDFVLSAAKDATHCADCEKPITAEDELALLVEIQQHNNTPHPQERQFTAYICHRTCQTPDLTLRSIGQ